MKQLLIALLLFPFLASSQVRTFTPTGQRTSVTPVVTITNSTTETTLFTSTIPANTLVPGKFYGFRIDVAVSTPLVNLATLTIKVKYGSQTLSVINGAGLTIGSTSLAPISITGQLVSRSMSSQYAPIMVNQSMGNVISLTTSNALARGLMTVDASQAQTFSVTAQFGGLGGATCQLVVDWVLISDF